MKKFGIAANFQNVIFTITTRPTRGTCTTRLTDYNTGDIVAERETAGWATLRVRFTGWLFITQHGLQHYV